MIAETIEGVTLISLTRDTVLSETSDRDAPDESRVKFAGNILPNNLLFQQILSLQIE